MTVRVILISLAIASAMALGHADDVDEKNTDDKEIPNQWHLVDQMGNVNRPHSCDKNTLSQSTLDGKIQTYDFATGETKTLRKDYKGRPRVFSRDGHHGLFQKTDADYNAVEIIDMKTGKLLFEVKTSTWKFAFASAANKVLIGNTFYDLKTGKNVGTFDTTDYSDVELSPDGKTIALVDYKMRSDRSDVSVVDVATKKVLFKKTLFGHPSPTTRLSPDGKSLALTSPRAQVWDIASGKLDLEIKSRGEPPYDIRWNPDGKQIVVMDKGNLFSYDVKLGARVKLQYVDGENFLLCGDDTIVSHSYKQTRIYKRNVGVGDFAMLWRNLGKDGMMTEQARHLLSGRAFAPSILSALGVTPPEKFVGALAKIVTGMESEDPGLRDAASTALEKLVAQTKDSSEKLALAALLMEQMDEISQPDLEVRRRVKRALSNELRELLPTSQRLQDAVEAVLASGDVSAKNALKKMMTDKPKTVVGRLIKKVLNPKE